MGKRNKPTAEDRADEEACETLIKIGKQLISGQKASKDTLLKHLKSASRILEEAPQSSDRILQATSDLCKAIGRPEFLKHKDREVRLYTTVCAFQMLRLHVPASPFTDSQLETLFRLLLSAFKDLEDPAAAHFQVCLGLLDTAATIKCCLLMLDLEAANTLMFDLFSTLFDCINAENKECVEGHAVQVLSSMLDESDDIPQPLLDSILGHLLPGALQESPPAHRLAQLLLRRCQPTLQPYIQKFLTRLLEGARTDSELAGSCSDLILQVYKASPQIMLPVMPHLQPGLQVESEERRLDAVDLLCKLLTQPGGHSLLTDYPHLPEAVLGRLNDRSAEVRLRVLSHAKSLANAFTDDAHRQSVADAVALRLQDPEERIRAAAAAALCGIAGDHPQAVRSRHYQALVPRLRDKRLPVRKEVAAQVAKLVRTWCLKLEDSNGASHGISKTLLVDLMNGVCGLTLTKDTELAAFVLDDLFKQGVFPSRLPAASTAQWWGLAWNEAGPNGRLGLSALLKGKCDLQRQVQELLHLRERVKSQKAAARQSFGSPQAGSLEAAAGSPDADNNNKEADKEEDLVTQLESRVAQLALAMRDVPKAEDGLQRLFGMKDNHVFRDLATLAAFGTPYTETAQVAKDLQSRVGARGAVADVVQALSARLSPNIISPEVLAAALEVAGESEQAHRLVIDVAGAAPQLYAKSLSAITPLVEGDDPLAAEAATRVLALAGTYIFPKTAGTSTGTGTSERQTLSPDAVSQLREMCLAGTPTGAKAAVQALAYGLGRDTADGAGDEATPPSSVLQEVALELLESLRSANSRKPHSRILSELKALSMAMRMQPELLEEMADELYDCVINHLLTTDLSKGKPLAFASSATDSEVGLCWGKPSPDVAIKGAAIKALAQALVPQDPTVTPTAQAAAVATTFASQLGELVDIDPSSEAFVHFKWRLLEVKWASDAPTSSGSSSDSGGRKRKAPGAYPEGAETIDPDSLTEEDREALICETAEVSPDAAWVRLCAATALFRLCRGFDASLTGNEYVVLGLACQDRLVEVRRMLLDKITAGVAYFQNTRSNPQRAAKLAALYALFAADPNENNVSIAYSRLREYAARRRGAVERGSIAAAAAGESGTMINEMPEFILPFLIFFIAHHPDYDPEALSQGDATFMDLFQRSMQLALEVVLLPDGASPGAPETAAEVSRRANACIKLLRQLKYCDVLEIHGGQQIDPGATKAAHQLCDIGLALARQIIKWAVGSGPVNLQKFPGKVALPRLCFSSHKDLSRDQKRSDGSDLPHAFHPMLEEPLFSSAYGISSPPAVKAARPKGRSKPREQVVEQAGPRMDLGIVEQPLKGGATPKRKAPGAKAGKAAAKPKRKPAAAQVKPVGSPKRQQPRRGAKDVAGDKLRDMELDVEERSEDEADDDASMSDAESDEEPRPAAHHALRAPTSEEESSGDDENAGWTDSPGQENDNKKLNAQSVNANAVGPIKVKAPAAKPRAKRVKA